MFTIFINLHCWERVVIGICDILTKPKFGIYVCYLSNQHIIKMRDGFC